MVDVSIYSRAVSGHKPGAREQGMSTKASQRLQDRIAVVVGAGSSGPGWGNGKATAVLFSREGARVVAIDINAAAAEETASIIRDEGGTAVAMSADVTNPSEVDKLVDQTIRQFGRIDILHNNVGIHRRESMASISVEDWDFIIDTNLNSAFLTCRAVLPHMVRQGKGAIVNISSIAALRYARRSFVAYSTSKGALLSLTRIIAVEYAAKGIRANSILPGHIDTPMVRQGLPPDPVAVEAFVNERATWCPMGRMGDAWDVAHAALFLVSDEAKYITGAELVVDGGLTSATAW
jgi:NAD(P)-dependent dehydrogenase (short-subunit alcohol dehydrogenase family)